MQLQSFGTNKRGALITVLLTVLLLLGVFAFSTPVHADELQDPEFRLRVSWPPPVTGFIVRGGDPAAIGQDHFPVFPIGGFGCDYLDSTISVSSHFAFTGDVTLEWVNLPAGVTSETAGSLSITGPTPTAADFPSTPMALVAAGDAALGDFTVTLRATSGDLERTVDIPISVVDELPECQFQEVGFNPAGPDSVRIDRAEYDADKDELRVEATECCDFADTMLWVTVAATDEVIGALEHKDDGEFRGRLSWPVDPVDINVISSSRGGWQTGPVELK